MYSGDYSYTVEPLVSKLSFAGISVSKDLVQDTGATDTDYTKEAFQLRESAVAVLKELYVIWVRIISLLLLLPLLLVLVMVMVLVLVLIHMYCLL
jgi:lipopolysaccharide/colanic/teichoic acid biosynthesis glycosyltransferase